MRGRADDPSAGALMKLVEWPDNFPDLTHATPNLKALRRIMAGFALMLVASIVMVFVTMAHPPRPRAVIHAAHLPCNCAGHCTAPRNTR